MIDQELQNILSLVDQYITKKHNSKEWRAGEDWVQYAGPYFSSLEYTKAIESLLSEWLVMGVDSLRFEQKFPKSFGKNFGVLTNSGSSSNLLMMSALASKRLYNLPKGTKVITPAAGFPTTLNPIIQNGFEPVFVDVELDTLNLKTDEIEDAAKSGAKVITFAHVLGNPPNMKEVMEVVRKYELILLEDCCDALNSFYEGEPLGSFGEMASCSFYPAHHITMGEGGFVACNNKQQETVARSLREWGRGCFCVGKKANLLKNGTCGKRFCNWLPEMPEEIFDHKYIYEEIGYNLKPIELQASMGLVQLNKLGQITEIRKRNHASLIEIFKPYEEHFILPRATEGADVNWFAFALTIKDNALFNRAKFVNFLEDRKIQTRPYFAGCILLQPAYSGLYEGDIRKRFPNAVKSTTNTLFLGTSPVVSREQLGYIKETVDGFFSQLIY
jgi:CDP-4-dehydro-6-deoxyglucose reductase, E1